jgi:hypothetical protein
MMPIAHVVHRSPGRLRLRIADRKRDESYFSSLAFELRSFIGVKDVQSNPLTASVLFVLEPTLDAYALLAEVEARGILRLRESEVPEGEPLLKQATDFFNRCDAALREATYGRVDLSSALFVILLALSVVQVLRGQPLASASSLLMSALAFLPLKQAV